MYDKNEVQQATLEYFGGDAFATDAWMTKYALKNKEGDYLEKTPDDMHKRMAREFARIEQGYEGGTTLTEEEIYQYLKDFKYIVPQGSPMYGIGNPGYSSLSNCVVVESAEDSVSSIFDRGKDLANLYKMRCGVGKDLSKLRPEGMRVNNSAGTTSGAWSFADFYSYVTRMIGQNARRGALMLSMDVTHPDIRKFITMKEDKTKVTGANVSVKATDEFMRAVERNGEYELKWQSEDGSKKYVEMVSAREVWDLIIHQATHNAEPGVLFWDAITRNLPAHEYEGFETLTTNPCFRGDTMIAVADGRNEVSLQKLVEEGVDVPVYSVNPETGKVSIKMGRNPRKTSRNQRLVRIHLDGGGHVDVTPNHRFPMRDGSEKRAKDLEPGDSFMRFTKNAENISPSNDSQDYNHRVTSVEELDGHHEVYSLTVDDNHTLGIVTNRYENVKGNINFNGIYAMQCGEVPLSAGDSCRLISLNLKHLVTNRFTAQAEFDFDKFEDVVEAGMRLVDDLVDLELEKLDKILDKVDTEGEKALWKKLRHSCETGRRTGLGTHALADCLANLCLPYDSDEAIEMVGKIYKVFRDTSYRTSVQLAKERGAFPVWDWKVEKDNEFINRLPQDIIDEMKIHGRRNISLLTCAPTGTVSALSQTSSGVEPVFRNSYTRRRKLGSDCDPDDVDFIDELGDAWQEHEVYHHNIEEYMAIHGRDEIPDYFVTSDQINWERRVDIQAAMGEKVDHSISSTLNLPKGTSEEVVSNIYMRAWKMGLKGITVYVDGSRTGVLLSNDDTTTGQPKSLVEALKSNGCIAEDAEYTDEDVITDGVKLGEVMNNGPTQVIRREGGKYYIHMSYLTNDPNQEFPVALWIHSNNMVQKEWVTMNRAIKKVATLIETTDVKRELIDETIAKFKDDPHHVRLGKIISMAMRHNIPLTRIVKALEHIEDDYIATTLTAVRKFLKNAVKDGTVVSDKTCEVCGSESIVYEEGCHTCKSCGNSGCN